MVGGDDDDDDHDGVSSDHHLHSNVCVDELDFLDGVYNSYASLSWSSCILVAFWKRERKTFAVFVAGGSYSASWVLLLPWTRRARYHGGCWFGASLGGGP